MNNVIPNTPSDCVLDQLVQENAVQAGRILELTAALDGTTASCNELAAQVVKLSNELGAAKDNLRYATAAYAGLKEGVAAHSDTIRDFEIEVDRLHGVQRDQDELIRGLRAEIMGFSDMVANRLALANAQWWAAHVDEFMATDRVSVGCLVGLLDHQVNALPVELRHYSQEFNARVEELVEGGTEPCATTPTPASETDVVDALVAAIRAHNPNVNLVMRRKPG